MINGLVKLANHLDKIGFSKEADYIDYILKTSAYEDDPDSEEVGSLYRAFEEDFDALEQQDFNREQHENIDEKELAFQNETQLRSNIIENRMNRGLSPFPSDQDIMNFGSGSLNLKAIRLGLETLIDDYDDTGNKEKLLKDLERMIKRLVL